VPFLKAEDMFSLFPAQGRARRELTTPNPPFAECLFIFRPKNITLLVDEVKAKSKLAPELAEGRPAQDFSAAALTSHASLLGVVYLKRKSFYYLNSPL
jgi:hypothetical protein